MTDYFSFEIMFYIHVNNANLIEDTALIFENTPVHINLELKCNITLSW